jgi:D-serine deaminase-like pyridoxal phosphate-dependent protein
MLHVLVDHPAQVAPLAKACVAMCVEVGVMVDVNSGMNRTGIEAGAEACALVDLIRKTRGVRFEGLHSYGSPPAPGGPSDREPVYRRALQTVLDARTAVEKLGVRVPRVLAGNSMDFTLAATIAGIDGVPGTWISGTRAARRFADHFAYAALVVGRVIVNLPHALADAGQVDLGRSAIPTPVLDARSRSSAGGNTSGSPATPSLNRWSTRRPHRHVCSRVSVDEAVGGSRRNHRRG